MTREAPPPWTHRSRDISLGNPYNGSNKKDCSFQSHVRKEQIFVCPVRNAKSYQSKTQMHFDECGSGGYDVGRGLAPAVSMHIREV